MSLLASGRGRKILFAALYLSEGAPIGYIWWALPTRLRAAGVAVEEVTALSALLVLPWVLKFLWAPLVDTLRTRGWGRRQWIVASQICMGLSLVPLLVLPIEENLGWIRILLLLHAVSAATQDVAVDALAIASVPSRERGSINGWMQAGMLAGRAVFGGGALYAERFIGEDRVILALVVCVWISMILVLRSGKEPEDARREAGGERLRVFAAALRRAFSRRATWLGLAFAVVGGAAFEGVGAVAGPFLIDRGAPQETVGIFFALPVVFAMALGALLGGLVSDRVGPTWAIAGSMGVIAAAVAALAVLVKSGAGVPAVLACLALVYLMTGAFTASSYALFMDLTDPKLGATQFSAFMGATNLCEMWAAYGVGRLVAGFGYPAAFLAFASIGALGVLVVRAIARAIPSRTTTASTDPIDPR